jgi:hypothetical protein
MPLMKVCKCTLIQANYKNALSTFRSDSVKFARHTAVLLIRSSLVYIYGMIQLNSFVTEFGADLENIHQSYVLQIRSGNNLRENT